MKPSDNSMQRILRVTSDDIISKSVSKKMKRSTRGCCSCKKRKVKCDEGKPKCKNCNRIKLDCQWPEATNHGYKKVVYIKSALINKKEDNNNAETWPAILCDSSVSPTSYAFSPPSIFPPEQYRLWLPGVDLSRQDAYFYFSFIDRFLPTIAHPFVREKVSTTRLLLRHAAEFPILREIYFACGVSILAFDFPSYKEIATTRYSKALALLFNVMKGSSVDMREDWLLNAVQMLQILCLRDNFTKSGSIHGLQHFRVAYKIIAKRLQSYSNELDKFHSSLVLVEYEKAEISSRFWKTFSPFNRVLVENLVFNYSVVILFCEHKDLETIVPNPFKATALFSFYSTVDSSMKDNWFNINVFGPTTEAFEIAAKCTWLCRRGLPLDADNIEIHRKLLANAEMNLSIAESTEDNSLNITTHKNMTIAEIMLRGSIILLRKMLNLETVCASDFQPEVNNMIKDIANPYNDDIIFPVWSLVVGSFASKLPIQWKFFRSKLVDLLHRSSSYTIQYVLNYLDGIWELYEDEGPFELLFKTTILDRTCI